LRLSFFGSNYMQTRQHLFLIGFMGCGKTYWGQLLAQKTGLPFLDLDDCISKYSGQSIARIFSKKGESAFREIERDTLLNLADLPPSIIATGGGTPCFFDNMTWMNTMGTTIYLKTPPTLLAKRLSHEKGFRPLLAGVSERDLEGFIEKKLAKREPFYLRAKVILEQRDAEVDFLEKLMVQFEGIE
jgi:shikimate kinase